MTTAETCTATTHVWPDDSPLCYCARVAAELAVLEVPEG